MFLSNLGVGRKNKMLKHENNLLKDKYTGLEYRHTQLEKKVRDEMNKNIILQSLINQRGNENS
jgi:hypothetical protein